MLIAKSGEEAIETALQIKPSLILLDIMMPGIDGYETCRRLKNAEATRDIDVIFVSSHDTAEEKLAGYDAGGCDYLIKPVGLTRLVETISAALASESP